MSCRNLRTFRRNALLLYFEKQMQKASTSELSVPFTILHGVTFRKTHTYSHHRVNLKFRISICCPPKRPFSAIPSWRLLCILSGAYISNVPERLQLKPHEKYCRLHFHIPPAWYFNNSLSFSIYFSLFLR